MASARTPSTATISHPFGDPLLNAWTLAWDADRIRHGFAGYWDGLFFYPYRDSVAYSEHLLGIALFTAPLQWLTGNPILVLNVATIASTTLLASTTFLLARELTSRTDAALLAGVAAACSPYRLGHDYHLQVLVSGWMPLALLGLHRYLGTGTTRALVLLVAAFTLQALSNGYFLFFTALPLAVVGLHGLWRRRTRWRLLVPRLLGAAVTMLALVAPVAIAYARVRREQGFTRTLADVSQYAATPVAYLQVSPRAWLWGRMLPHGGDEMQLFPGLVVLVLAVMAVVAAAVQGRSSRDATRPDARELTLLYAGIVVLMALLSLGPYPLSWLTSLPVSGPYGWLMAVLPGFDGLRVPARLAVVVVLGLAVLAAFGFAVASASWSRRARAVSLAAVCVGIGIEGYGGAYAIAPFPTESMVADRDLYAWLQTQPAGPVLELPVGDAAIATRHLYRTLEHGNRIANGYSGYGSALQDFLAGPPFTEVARLDGALAMARGLGIRWVVVHPPLYEYPAAGAALAEALARGSAHVVRSRRFESATVFELQPGQSRPAIQTASAWRPLAPDAFGLTASHGSDALPRLVDGDIGTRWSTGTRQQGGEWVVLDVRQVGRRGHASGST